MGVLSEEPTVVQALNSCLEEICSVKASEWYDWAEITIWWDNRSRVYRWISETGCSCSYFGEGFPSQLLGELRAGPRDLAMKALTEFWEDAGSYSDRDRTAYDAARESLRSHRDPVVAPFIAKGGNVNLADGVL